MILTLESRIQRLDRMIGEGRIIRNSWVSSDEQGRETACLLAALSPEAGAAENPDFCPAEVMPEWLAHMTPWMDDYSSDTEWPRVIRRYAACAAKWDALDEAAWCRVESAARRATVEEAMRHAAATEAVVSATAAWAAGAVAAAWAAGAVAAAKSEAADRIINAILSALETECGICE